MYQIELPADPQSLTQVITKYFYGCFPNYRVVKSDGDKAYYPYYCHTAGYAQDSEPDPLIIAQAHVAGLDTWATRAVCGDQAFFAAWDVDTTDSGLLDLLRTCLHDTYGSLYNWEQSASGVHVWLLWEGTIDLTSACELVNLLSIPPELRQAMDVVYPLRRNTLRLPFPNAYYPVPAFNGNELIILEDNDLTKLLKKSPESINHQKTSMPGSMVSSSARCPREYQRGHEECSSILWDTSRTHTLKAHVDVRLAIPPADGKVYNELISFGLLSHTIAVYGKQDGLLALEGWIRTGNPKKIKRRISELHKYQKSNESKGYWTINGAICLPTLLPHYTPNLFDQFLSFVGNKRMREEVDAVLYILLVSHLVAQHLYLDEWFVSTRQLAEMLHSLGFAGYEHVAVGGRKKAGRRLSWVVEGLGRNNHPVFHITQDHDTYSARRLTLNPDYEWLLECMPEELLADIQTIPNYGRKRAAGTQSKQSTQQIHKSAQHEADGEDYGLDQPSVGAISWDEVKEWRGRG